MIDFILLKDAKLGNLGGESALEDTNTCTEIFVVLAEDQGLVLS